MQDPEGSDRPFAISDLAIGGDRRARTAMVVTPRRPMVVDRQRIARLRQPSGLSDVERWMLSEARRRGDGCRILLFRAVDDRGQRLWEFDPSLEDHELEEAGYVMARALLPFHRRLLVGGTVLMVHTDWGLRECYAMRDGDGKLADELESSGREDAVTRTDIWILRNMLLHVALSLDHVLNRLLPDHLSAVDRRWPHVQTLTAELPPDAVG